MSEALSYRPAHVKLLKVGDLKLLKAAIDMAEEWRGQYVGHEDAEPVLEAFDRQIAATRQALDRVRKLNRAVKGLTRA
jgi:hypothetical protein